MHAKSSYALGMRKLKHCQGESQKLHTVNWSTVDGLPKQQGETDQHTEDFLSYFVRLIFFIIIINLNP
jgi:F0F1-type ATP synthase membrane subunit a